MEPAKSKVMSPCKKICKLNAADICVGCFRSKDERKQWRDMDDDARRQVLKNCHDRKEQARIAREAKIKAMMN